jgi:hypothetical protein
MVFESPREVCFSKLFGTSASRDDQFFIDVMASGIRKLNIVAQMPSLKQINL